MSDTLTKQQQKEKIRERYKGVDPDILEVIPARKQADFYDDIPRRVAVYVRVSTGDPKQTSSYELQKNYYEDKVERHENWTLVEIYADEGISGTSLKHREQFNRMIRDAMAFIGQFSFALPPFAGWTPELSDVTADVVRGFLDAVEASGCCASTRLGSSPSR